MALLLVMTGGALGVAARAALTVPHLGGHPLTVPAITVVINIAGSLLLGIVVGWLDDRHPRLRTFLGTGVLGGFTTYSAFAVHGVTAPGAAPVVGLVLIAVSLVGGVAAAALGLRAGRRIAGVPEEIEAPEDAE